MSPTNVLLASAGEDVRLWTMPNLSLQGVKNGTNANVVYCSCSNNGQFVAYAHEEQGLNVASLQDDDFGVIHIPTPCEQSNVVFNSNSRYLVSGGVDCVVNIWDIKSRTAKRSYKDHVNPVTFCIFNYNDNVIASASDHGEILLSNVQSGISGEPLHADETQAIRSLAYSYFSRSLLASASDSGAINLWDTKSQKMVKSFTDHKGPATGISFSPLNDMLLCSSGLDKRIVFYDVTGKKTVKTINTEGPVTCCDFMHDGCTVAAGTASGHLFLFDLRQGSTPIKLIPGHKTSVRSVSFQRVPKEGKSPRRLTDEAKASNSNVAAVTPQRRENSFTLDSMKSNDNQHRSLSRESSSSQIPKENVYAQKSASTTNLYNTRETSSSNLMSGRENSTLALHNIVNQNKPPEMMSIPAKAAKLMGDDIFSPIKVDPSVQSKKSVLRTNSKARPHDTRPQSVSIEAEEAVRPGFFRSKSGGLSKFSIMNRSSDDLSIHRKGKDEKPDKEDGVKKNLLGFKSPFKKKGHAYNKHSDESETSSIDSFSIVEDREKHHTLPLRNKKDRLSDRSIDSGNRPTEYKTELQAPLSDTNKSPSIHSGDFVIPHSQAEAFQFNNTGVSGAGQFQVDFIQRMIDNSMEEHRESLHSDIVNLQVEMIRQMEIQKEQIRQMLQSYSVNDELLLEIERLRLENEKLRTKY